MTGRSLSDSKIVLTCSKLRSNSIFWLDNGNFALFNYSTGDRYYSLFKDHQNVVFPKVVAGHTIETKERLGQISQEFSIYKLK